MSVAVKQSRAAYLRGWRARKRGDLLPFQKAFVAALTRKEKAPDILGAVGPTRQWKIVVVRPTDCAQSHPRGCAARGCR